MTVDINQLRRLAQAATPGPWKTGQYLGSLQQFVIHTDAGDRGRGSDVALTTLALGSDETVANARLIAAANPAAVTELLDRKEMIEVALSEAQWATFVSSLSVGGGVPCTLQHLNGQPVPQLKPPTKTTEKFSADIKAVMKATQDDLKKIAESLTDGNIGKTKAKELQKALQLIAVRLTGSTGFVADQFDEHMEHTVERAKVEVNVYIVGMVQKAGLDALGAKYEPISLEYKERKNEFEQRNPAVVADHLAGEATATT